MPKVIVPNPIELSIITTLVAVDGLLHGAKLKIFTNVFVPTPNSVIGDFTEATFDGYAESSSLVWGAPYYRSDGQAVVAAASKQFQAADPLTSAEVCQGWFMVSSDGTQLLASELFPAPVSVRIPLQAFEVIAAFPIDYLAG